MLGTIDIEVNAKFPNMPLEPMFTYVGSASSVRIRNVPKKIGNWQINAVYINVKYPNDTVKSTKCVLVGGIWIGTVEGCQISGKSEKGYTIYARGVDENGNDVSDHYVLGKGDVIVIESDGTITPGQDVQYVHLLSAQSTQPQEGDLYPTNDGYMIWQNGEANQLGTPFDIISNYVSSYVDTQLSTKQDKLTDQQISAIDAVVDERETVVVYSNGAISALYIDGAIETTSIPNIETAVDVKLGTAVSSIADFAFSGCRSLTSMTVPASVTIIGNSAFDNCSGLTSMTIGNSVTNIGSGAFYGCSNLTSATIPDSVASIGIGVFEDCSGLTSVTIPNSVTSIGDDAFVGCSNLANLTFLGRTLEQVQNIEDEEGEKYYPWGITDTSIITTWNGATQEWVEASYVKARVMTESEYAQITPQADTIYFVTEDPNG